MKTIYLVLAVILCTAGNAQINSIPENTKLEYNVFPDGYELRSDLTLEKVKPDTVVIGWVIYGNGNRADRQGRRTMTASSLKQGREGFWNPPFDGEDILIPDNQVMLLLSVDGFSELKKSGQTLFDGQLLKLDKKNDGKVIYKAGSRELSAVHATNESGATRIWILDNPAFPLILKLEGNPYDVNVELLDFN